jgi:WD40 repeat protein
MQGVRVSQLGQSMIKKQIHTAAMFLVLAATSLAGCSLITGNSPTGTMQKLFSLAEANDPDGMTQLFSSGYLEKNKKLLENNREFIKTVQQAKAGGEKLAVSKVEERYVGEKAIVKLRYGSDRGSIPFQARLIKENGQWKIEELSGNSEADLSKEEAPIERSKEFLREIEVEQGSAGGISFSPDGKTLGYTTRVMEQGASKFFIYLVDAQTGAVKSTTNVSAQYNLRDFQFSPDGKLFACGDGNKKIYIWDASNPREPKQTITFNESDTYEDADALAFAPDGSLYAVGSTGSLIVYDANTGKLKQKLEGHPRETKDAAGKKTPQTTSSGLMVYQIVFSQDGKLFASVAESEVKIWDAKTGKALKKLSLPAEITNGVTNSNIISAAFAADGKTLETYSRNGLLQNWNIQSGEVTGSKDLEKLYVGSAVFSADGKLMTDSGGKSDDPPRGVRIYDAATGEIKATLKGNMGQPSAAFSPDGKMVASRSDKDGNKIFLWDISGTGR